MTDQPGIHSELAMVEVKTSVSDMFTAYTYALAAASADAAAVR